MRIVLVHRYFWPDTPPYAHILHGIALSLGEAGHDVTVLTCQPSYRRSVVARAPAHEQLGPHVRVVRWSVLPDRRFAVVKLINLVWFCLRLTLAAPRLRGADVVMAASTPPIAVAKLVGWLARRKGARFVYHKQDVYPEVVTAPGIMREGRISALLRWLDARTERAADRVVVLSEDMADTVAARGVARSSIEIINNFDPWVLDENAPAQPEPSRAENGALQVVFAGNLGRFQNLETVFGVAERVRDDERIVFHFFGDGALAAHYRDWVERNALRNVRLHGFCPPQEVAEFLRTRADLGIVSVVPGVIRAAYPSKTMSYLRQGCPVLALVESDSALARDIAGAGAGFHSPPDDAAAAARLVRELAHDPAPLARARGAASTLYIEQFDRTRQLKLWSAMFAALDGSA